MFAGHPGGEGAGQMEASLDIQYLMGVAPGIETEFWYYGSSTPGMASFDIFNWTMAGNLLQTEQWKNRVSYTGY